MFFPGNAYQARPGGWHPKADPNFRPVRLAVAGHEAGHALAFVVHGERLTEVLCRDDGSGFCGIKGTLPAWQDAICTCAGPAADFILRHHYLNLPPKDSWATHRQDGDYHSTCRKLASIGRCTQKDFDECCERGREIVTAHWPALIRLAEELYRLGTMSGDEIHALLGL